MRLSAEARREGKCTAPARRAVHGDGSTHKAHQSRGDGQSQAGAAVLACGGRVLLLEGPEDALLLLGWDADTRVAHREVETNVPRRQKRRSVPLAYFDVHDDFTLVRELDYV